jgi:quercetin dioxygenase-like cupin family protein
MSRTASQRKTLHFRREAFMSQPVIRSVDQAPANRVDRARGAFMQVLLGPEDGAPTFATRLFTLEPGGRIPNHRHDTIEHEQVVIAGEMTIGLGDRQQVVRAGDCLLIPAGVAHWYENRGKVPVRFLCAVPITTDYQTEWLEE